MEKWEDLASDEAIQNVLSSLNSEGITGYITENGEEAKKKALSIIPKGVEVMTMSSQTLEVIGLTKEINESGNYDSLKMKLSKMDRATQGPEMIKLGATPEWAIGSVHAVTEDGHIFVASNTGSQLGAYAFSAQHVIWVVGTQKIVKNMDEGMKRVYDYSLPKESERQKSIGNPNGSSIGKLLIINKEFRPERITMIFVKKRLGF